MCNDFVAAADPARQVGVTTYMGPPGLPLACIAGRRLEPGRAEDGCRASCRGRSRPGRPGSLSNNDRLGGIAVSQADGASAAGRSRIGGKHTGWAMSSWILRCAVVAGGLSVFASSWARDFDVLISRNYVRAK